MECPRLTANGSARCAAHERARQRAYNQRRPARHRLYGTAEWRRFREQALTQLGRICAFCGTYVESPEFDHIIPIEERPDLVFEIHNVQPLCKPCHSSKTATEDGRWG